MSTLDDLLQPVTYDEAKASIYEVISITGVDVTSWKPGAPTRTLVAAVAIIFVACSTLIALIAGAGYLEIARGTWLTFLAQYFFGLTRDPATAGTCTVRLTNSGGGVYTWDPGDLVLLNPDTGKSYRNVLLVNLGATTFVEFDVFSAEVGSASTSTVGTIVQLETAYDGVSVTNLTSCISTDAELDSNLIVRCQEVRAAKSPFGPHEIYSKTAREAKRSDGTPTQVTRTRIVKDGYGTVYVYCATATGAATGDPFDAATDLGAIQLALLKYAAPLGVTVIARAAGVHVIDISYTAYLKDTAGVTSAQAGALLNSALGTFAAKTPVGGLKIDEAQGGFFLDGLRAEMGAAIPDQVLHVNFTLPADDVYLNAGDVPTIGVVNWGVNFRDQSAP